MGENSVKVTCGVLKGGRGARSTLVILSDKWGPPVGQSCTPAPTLLRPQQQHPQASQFRNRKAIWCLFGTVHKQDVLHACMCQQSCPYDCTCHPVSLGVNAWVGICLWNPINWRLGDKCVRTKDRSGFSLYSKDGTGCLCTYRMTT